MRELRRTMSGAKPEFRGGWRRRPRAKSRVRMQDLRSGDAAGGHEVDGGEGGGEAARGGEAEESVLERLKVGRGAARVRTVDATKNRPKACKSASFRGR